MFVEVVRVAREMGVVRFGTLSVDGTKVRANASKRKAMSYGRMLKEEARLKEEIAGLLDEAAAPACLPVPESVSVLIGLHPHALH